MNSCVFLVQPMWNQCVMCIAMFFLGGRRASSCERTTNGAPSGKAGDGIFLG